MKCLVVGCGSIGERHIRNLKKINADESIACDSERRSLINFKNGAICEIHLDFIRPGHSKNWEVTGTSSDANDIYIKDAKHFLNAVNTLKKPLINECEEGNSAINSDYKRVGTVS